MMVITSPSAFAVEAFQADTYRHRIAELSALLRVWAPPLYGGIIQTAFLPFPLDDDPIAVQVFSAEQLSNEQYHAETTHVSSSRLKEILKSPAHFLIAQEERESTAAMRFGTTVHCALLEPDRFAERYVVDPGFDRRTKEGKANAAAFAAEHAGMTLVSSEDLAAIARIREGLRKHETAHALLTLPDRLCEQSIFWRDPITQIHQKVRPDLRIGLHAGSLIVDLKKSRSADRFSFSKQCVELGYHVSAAMYCEGVRIAFGDKPRFAWLVVESSGVVSLYEPDADLCELGEKRYRRALITLASCIESNRWPAYQDGRSIEPLSAPKWAFAAD